MSAFRLTEFKPTILFLVKFIGIYLAGNLIYGTYITAFEPHPDPATRTVTQQSGLVLESLGWPNDVMDSQRKATTSMHYRSKPVLDVYEGCNGLNVMVVFLSFVAAFGAIKKDVLWFMPIGILIIHIANIGRIVLLFLVGLYFPEKMYFAHKYFFTAFIYVVVLALWIWWVRRRADKPDPGPTGISTAPAGS